MAKVPRSQVSQAVANLSLKRGVNPKQLAKEVAAYLLEERRIGELDSLLRDVQSERAKSGQVEVLARVARPLEGRVSQDLKRPFAKLYPQAKKVTLTPVIDPSVIGGASLGLGEQRLDLSISRRLNRFKHAINLKGNS